MSTFQWVVAVGLFLTVVALFSIAAAIRHVSKVIAEVVIGLVANVRAKPIAVKPVTKQEEEEEEDL